MVVVQYTECYLTVEYTCVSKKENYVSIIFHVY